MLSTEEIAKDITIAALTKVNVINGKDFEEMAKNVGIMYKGIYKAVSEAKSRPEIKTI